MIRLCSFFIVSLTLATLIITSPVQAHSRDDLITQLVSDSGFERVYLEELFSDSRLVTERAETSVECRAIRRDIFENEESPWKLLEEYSLKAGIDYYNRHKDIFTKTYENTKTVRHDGVRPEFILGLLRIETYFGVCLGDYYVLPRLYALYVFTHNPRKRAFVLREIGALLRLTRKYDWDIYAIVGSESGALGIAQFIPSSFKFAVDGNNDSVIDLFNPEDAIPSIANYLIINHWYVSKKSALLNYNHNSSYVDWIFRYAEKIKNKLK